jgi:hypothetical protein
MKISGHKTRSIFDRYNISGQEGLKEAAERRVKYHNSQKRTGLFLLDGYNIVTICLRMAPHRWREEMQLLERIGADGEI